VDERRPRVWARMQRMPVEREVHKPEPMTAVRRDGTTCDIRRTLGLPSVPAQDADYGVTWTPWPPP
jgi:hypothetical protein